VLILVGQLAKPSAFIHFWNKEIPIYLIATLLAVVFLDLLKGVALGIFISIIFVLKEI
jgi:MFS superfamily sulfate permease-like transporter